MFLKHSVMLVLTLALVAILQPEAKAEDSSAATAPTAGTSSSSGLLQNLQKKGIANYLLWVTGPNTQALSGNKDGTGTNLNLAHYFTLGYKISSKWSVTATQPVSQTIDDMPVSPTRTARFVVTDPYITFANSKIMHSDRYGTNLSGYFRYYAPISRGTHDALNKGTKNDTGYGVTRILFTPSKSWLDGKLTLNGTVLANIKFAKLSNEERVRRGGPNYREDFYFIFNPSISYSLTPKLDIYLEYATGYLRHTTDGKLSKLNHPVDGQYISPGLYWAPTKKVSLNPYLSLGPVFRGVRNTDIGIQAQYSFL